MFNYFYGYDNSAESYESSTRQNAVIALGIGLLLITVFQEVSGVTAITEHISHDVVSKLLSSISLLV